MGLDACIFFFFRENFLLCLAEVYLWERINVLARVLLHGREDEAGEIIPF